MRYTYNKAHLEAFFWLASIVFLALTTPNDSAHYTLCIFKNLGINYCPGCGLGHGIHHLLRGHILASWHSHPLAIIAIIILVARSYKLLKKDSILHSKKSNNE